MVLAGTDISIKDGTPSAKIFVIAVTYQRFHNWCWQHEINPRSPMVTYVRNASVFRGQAHVWFKDLGTSFERSGEIYRALEFYKHTRDFKEIPS